MFDQRGKVNEAEAGYDYARMDLLDKKNSLVKDVKNTYLELKDVERQVESYKTQILPGSQEIYRTALLSYEAGEIGYLELLQAKQTLVQAKEGYIEALDRYFSAMNLLEKLTGVNSEL
jgi:cobalt-zinc-cadmium resistance protein CzcA